MKTKRALTGAALGALLTAPLISLLWLGRQVLALSFPPFSMFNTMTRLLPGPVITFGIDSMISTLRLLGIDVAATAKTAEQVMAVLMFWAGGILWGAAVSLVLARFDRAPLGAAGPLVGAVFGLPGAAITLLSGDLTAGLVPNLIFLTALFLVWGTTLTFSLKRVTGFQDAESQPEEKESAPQAHRLNRRQFLVTLGASTATLTIAGAGLGQLLTRSRSAQGPTTGTGPSPTPLGPKGEPLPNADAVVQPVPGTRPEYTPVEDHYQVFIELTPEDIEESEWTLPLTGLVDQEMEFTLAELRENFTARNQYVTLSCISGRIPTSLISTTYWTGVSVQDLLAEAGVKEEAQYLYIESADGFYEIVSLDLIYSDPRIMFCYGWDGKPLPKDHGFPLRIWIPDRFGMKQPKWITNLEVVSAYQPGYWVERGWDKEALIKTRSVVDTVAVEESYQEGGQRLIPLGGIAFGGARGISRVEVRIDEGEWRKADLRSPLSDTTWVIWRYEWPFQAGEHTFAVRTFDGQGEMQTLETSPARPDGASGLHSISRDIA